MKKRSYLEPFKLPFLAALSLTPMLSTAPARADVVGRLHITVKNADNLKPVAGAKVTLHDTANVRADATLTTNPQGSVTSEELENRSFQITVQAEGYTTNTRPAIVAADVTSDVEVPLEPVEKTIRVTGNRSLLRPRDPTVVTPRDQSFAQRFASQVANPQQLTGLALSVPGFIQDSNNQVHPRGEHSATGIYVGGFQLGNSFQGRFGPVIVPDAVQSVDIMTGAYAPEYGAETAAILNTTIRSGTITPTYKLDPGFGGFGTRQGSFIVGGQAGAPAGPANATGQTERQFHYFINGTTRTTNNALEPPQPDNQTAHNHAGAQSLLGRFDYIPGERNQFTLTVNDAPSNAQVANRTGLPASYAPFGQGFGFGGARDASGNIPGADPTALGGARMLLPSAQLAGQDIQQKDNNGFGVLQWRHVFNAQTTSLFSVGINSSKLDVVNHNPGVNLGALSTDNSIEFNPTVLRKSRDLEGEGGLTRTTGPHTFKTGFIIDGQKGDETYQLIPASQLALDQLFATAPVLTPAGTPQVDARGNPVLDAVGNQVYLIKPGAKAPIVPVRRGGHYGAAYLQDTWKVNNKLTANYGLRYDTYKQNGSLGQAGIQEGMLGPRLNLSYALHRDLIGRLSYNRLFIEPPLSQGAILGSTIKPETINQYEASIQKQLKGNQSLRLSYYYKQIRNQVDTSLLIPSTQLGIYTSVNFDRDMVHGLEASYDLLPRNNIGPSAYVSYTYSIAKPGGLDNTGGPVPTFNDHDQRHTLSTGFNYTVKSGASAGANLYYGSGVASSAIVDDQRHSRTRVDMRLQTSPQLLGGRGGLRLDVENLFDNRALINFNSGFSGTRFQQGRRIVLSAFSNF